MLLSEKLSNTNTKLIKKENSGTASRRTEREKNVENNLLSMINTRLNSIICSLNESGSVDFDLVAFYFRFFSMLMMMTFESFSLLRQPEKF